MAATPAWASSAVASSSGPTAVTASTLPPTAITSSLFMSRNERMVAPKFPRVSSDGAEAGPSLALGEVCLAVGGDDVAADSGVGEAAGRRLGQPFAAHVSGGAEAGLGVDVEAAPLVEPGSPAR